MTPEEIAAIQAQIAADIAATGVRDINMEFRRVSIGFDIAEGIYFVADAAFQHLTIEAKSLSALHHKLEALELRPVLSSIYAKDAPEMRKASKPRTARQSSRRLDLAAIPSRAVQRYLLKVIENMDLRPPRAAA